MKNAVLSLSGWVSWRSLLPRRTGHGEVNVQKFLAFYFRSCPTFLRPYYPMNSCIFVPMRPFVDLLHMGWLILGG